MSLLGRWIRATALSNQIASTLVGSTSCLGLLLVPGRASTIEEVKLLTLPRIVSHSEGMSQVAGCLLVVGLSPPTTSGARTRARVDMACRLLNQASLVMVNLYAFPTRDLGSLSEVGKERAGWDAARSGIEAGLGVAKDVLLAYGVRTPAHEAGRHFRRQVAWLEGELDQRGLAVWQVGDTPRHPSRWQRFTHRSAPGVPFETALRLALTLRTRAAIS